MKLMKLVLAALPLAACTANPGTCTCNDILSSASVTIEGIGSDDCTVDAVTTENPGFFSDSAAVQCVWQSDLVTSVMGPDFLEIESADTVTPPWKR